MGFEWGKASGVFAAGLFVAVAVGAGIYSKQLSNATEFEREARTELVRFALGMVKCGKRLPDTGPMVPEAFESISGKPYKSSEEDWDSPSFSCSGFSVEGPQRLQYGWVKQQDGKGVVTARADVDGNGAPDTWFEIPVVCPGGGCVTVNFVYELDQDGVRHPPLFLKLLRRASAYLGEPPSLSPESPNPVPSEPSGIAADTKPSPAPELPAAGLPVALDALYFEGERRATSKQSGLALLLLEYQGIRDHLADPNQGALMRAHYGIPDGAGRVAKDAATVVATFDANGLRISDGHAPRPLKMLGFQECLPEQVLKATKLPMPVSMSLEWEPRLERTLWSIKSKSSTKAEHHSVSNCAQVDVTATNPH